MDYPVMRGDLVVGGNNPSESVFSQTGSKLVEDTAVVHGTERDLAKIKEKFNQVAANMGGKPLPLATEPLKSKRTRKATVKKEEPAAYPTEIEDGSYSAKTQPREKFTVQFENDFGRLKVKVVDVVEHELAFMVIFENEDDMTFEPKVGEKLSFFDKNREKYTVFYPGVTFDSTFGAEKRMILFKVEE